jgi:predicted lipoprotein with Yx(FWY)xxD motif
LKKSHLLAALALAAALAVAATALASSLSASQVKTRKTAALGTILVDGSGRTLYLFMKDKAGRSSCYGACAADWPPYLTTAKPVAGPGALTSMLGWTKRTDGKLQVTYNHHPLYHFKFDAKAGATSGENVEAFGGEWYVVSPKGLKVEPKSSSPAGSTTPTTPTDTGGYGGGYGG